MRRVEPSAAFKRDLRRAKKGRFRNTIEVEVSGIAYAIANGMRLPVSYRDHALHGQWEGSRECHIRPDLLLVYTLEGDDVLVLERLGSHAEIFGM